METNIYKIEGKKTGGIYTFINQNELEGDNLKFSKLYNKISPFYYFSQKIFSKIKFEVIEV